MHEKKNAIFSNDNKTTTQARSLENCNKYLLCI